MNILITGATGFVGTNLAKYFKNHLPAAQITGAGRTKDSLDKLTKNNLIDHALIYTDINEGVFNGYDLIVHTAGKPHDLKKTADDKAYLDANFELTKKIYQHFIDSKASKAKFVFLSSVKAVADVVKNSPLSESENPNPATIFGISKLRAEQFIQSRPISSEKKYFILRPCIIHGEGNKGNLNLLFKLLQKGIPYPLGAFENKRSFLTVENLCFTIKELLENDIESGVYNVADTQPLSTVDLVKIMGDALGKKIPIAKIPRPFIKFMANIGDVFPFFPLSSGKLNKLTESYVVDNTKLLAALKKDLPVSSKYGLSFTFKKF